MIRNFCGIFFYLLGLCFVIVGYFNICFFHSVSLTDQFIRASFKGDCQERYLVRTRNGYFHLRMFGELKFLAYVRKDRIILIGPLETKESLNLLLQPFNSNIIVVTENKYTTRILNDELIRFNKKCLKTICSCKQSSLGRIFCSQYDP
ncbi:MAG: hypothetical protein NZO16_05060 [Deltaproteobacteria bacterium]|nr:hypothetical protein [Deltaproteobacteria bacterium]